jgi:hypothetical protein
MADHSAKLGLCEATDVMNAEKVSGSRPTSDWCCVVLSEHMAVAYPRQLAKLFATVMVLHITPSDGLLEDWT